MGIVGIFAVWAAGLCLANPTGPQVVNGQVAITRPAPNVLNVTNSPGAIINWQGFSIGRAELTRFIQQSPSSAVLNRVIGSDPSSILGQLSSNGRVFLINPHGIVFGAGSVINTAGLVASTLNITDADFMTGRYRFVGDASAGSIVNQGAIRTTDNGPVFLIAPNIENSGIIETPGGTLVLAAGRSVEITSFDLNGITFQLQAPQDSVVNIGRLVANGGAAGMFAGTLRHSGEIRANSVSRDAQGNIVLAAKNDITLAAGSITSADGPRGGNVRIQSESGTTLVSGTVSATGSETAGGSVQILGERVGLFEHASIDASGASGGGSVLIGGDYRGENPAVQNAGATYVSPNATVHADALDVGDGGRVIVWGTDSARVYGTLTARGGPQGGDGGFIETSGHWLDLAGIKIDASATRGRGGTWLLDPWDLAVTAAVTTATEGPVGTFSSGSGATNVANTDISGLLNVGTSVILQTTGTAGDGNGDGNIAVSANIAKSGGLDATLTLLAHNSIIVSDGVSISSSSGKLNVVLNADRDANGFGNINLGTTPAGGVSIVSNGGNIVLGGGSGDPATSGFAAGAMVGSHADMAGVFLYPATLSSGAGKITIRGKGLDGVDFGRGVFAWSGSSLQTTGGNIEIVGVGGNGYAGSQYSLGVDIHDPNIAAGGSGTITISGAATATGNDNQGFGTYAFSPGGRIETASGAISITGASGGTSQGIWAGGAGITIGGASTTGPITLTAPSASGTGSIYLSNTAIETHGQNVVVNADANGAGSGNIIMESGSAIRSNGGDIVLGGGADPLTAYAWGAVRGVSLEGATLDAGAGDISIRGRGIDGFQSPGVAAYFGTIIRTTSGNITINGIGGNAAGTSDNYGVDISHAGTLVQSGTGLISITGQGGIGDGGFGNGIFVSAGAQIISTLGAAGTTAIILDGTGAAGAGSGGSNRGVRIKDAGTLISTQNGDISILGAGGSGGMADTNHGIFVSDGAQIVSSGSGNSQLDGTGGAGFNNNYGVFISGAGTRVSSAGGNIQISGQGGGTGIGSGNIGVLIENGAAIESTGVSAITLDGTGGAGTGLDSGVVISLGGTRVSAADGNIHIIGLGGTGTGFGKSGIEIQNGAEVRTTGAGAITLDGTGGASTDFNYGVEISGGGQVVSGGGAVNIIGIGGDGTNNNYGVRIKDAGTEVTSSAPISITGTGGNGSGTYNGGISIDSSALVSSNTSIDLVGHAGNSSAGYSYGVDVSRALVEATGTGTITVQGWGSNLGPSNRGVAFDGPGVVLSTANGDINITGTAVGNAATNNNVGLVMTGASLITSSGGGRIVITATGGAGTDYNRGFAFANAGSRILSSGSGNIQITGHGGGTGTGNSGIDMYDGAKIEATGSGTVTLAGDGPSGSGGNKGVFISDSDTTVTAVNAIAISGTGIDAGHRGIVVQDGASVLGVATANLTLSGPAGSSIEILGGTTAGVPTRVETSGNMTATAGGDIVLRGGDGAGAYVTLTGANQSVTSTAGGVKVMAGLGGSAQIGNTSGNQQVSAAGQLLVQANSGGTAYLTGGPGVQTITADSIVLDALGTQNQALVHASGGQTLSAKYIQLNPNVMGSSIWADGGVQTINTTGKNASGEGISIAGYNTIACMNSCTTQTINLVDADYLRVFANAPGTTAQISGGTQSITMVGSGLNAIELGLPSMAGDVGITGQQQTITAGLPGQSGSIKVQGGSATNASATLWGISSQTVTAAHNVEVIGGTAGNTGALITGGNQTVRSLGGDIRLLGGTGVSPGAGATAGIVSGGVGDQTIDAAGQLYLKGGPAFGWTGIYTTAPAPAVQYIRAGDLRAETWGWNGVTNEGISAAKQDVRVTNGIVMENHSPFAGIDLIIYSSVEQNVSSKFIELRGSNVPSGAWIGSTGGTQTVTTTGKNASGEGISLGDAASLVCNGACTAQTISVQNADYLRLAAGIGYDASITSAGTQNIAVTGLGLNAIELGVVGAIHSSYFSSPRQSVIAGNAGQSGSITLQAGAVPGYTAVIQQLGGTTPQQISTAGDIKVLGGTGGSGARIESDSGQSVSAQNIHVRGGSGGSYGVARIGSTGANQLITTGNELKVEGGTGGSNNYAEIQSYDVSGSQTLNVGGNLLVMGGNGASAYAMVGAASQDIHAGGDIKLLGGTGTAGNGASAYLRNSFTTQSIQAAGQLLLQGGPQYGDAQINQYGTGASDAIAGNILLQGGGVQSGVLIGTGNQLVQATAGDIRLFGGPDQAPAWISNGAGSQSIVASGQIHLKGGASNSYALISNYAPTLQNVSANSLFLETYGTNGSTNEGIHSHSQNINIANGITLRNYSPVYGTELVIYAAQGQTVSAGYIDTDAVANGAGAYFLNQGGTQAITTTGHNAANEGMRFGSYGGIDCSSGCTAQTVTVNNADYLRIAPTNGGAKISTTASQTVTLGGTGLQTIDLLGGAGTGAYAAIVSGGGVQTIHAGNVQLTGGNGTNSMAFIGNPVGPVNLTLGTVGTPISGTVTLTGGSGTNAYAKLGTDCGGCTSSIDVNSHGSVTLNAGGSDAWIGSVNGGGSVTVRSGVAGGNGDIAVNGGRIQLGGAATLEAARSIVLDAGASITTQGGGIVLNADRDNAGGGQIVMNTGTVIASNGGNIVLGGGANPLLNPAVGTGFAAAADKVGIHLNGASLSSGGGSVTLHGKGFAGTDNAIGIQVDGGSTISSGSGAITLDGTGGNGTDYNIGTYVGASTVTSASGPISIIGVGGAASATNNVGIWITSGAGVTSTGGASITINGTGGSGTLWDHGVYIVEPGTTISSNAGLISITGTAPAASSFGGSGVLVNNGAAVAASGIAGISILGTGAPSAGADNYGVRIIVGGSVTSSASGSIAITGFGGGGSGIAHKGVQINGAGSVVQSTGAGNIAITGTGGGSGWSPHGVAIENGASVISSGAGGIAIDGTGSGAGAAMSSVGVYMVNDTTKVQSVSGPISILGSGGGSGGNNPGIYLQNGPDILSTGAAPIALDGRSPDTSPGIVFSGPGVTTIGGASAAGDVTIIAHTPTGADSIQIASSADISSNGTRALTLKPLNAPTSVGLAGGAGTFNLDVAELDTISGFASVAIGHPAGTGMITGGAYNISDPTLHLILQSPGAASAGIALNGALNMNGAALALNTTGPITLNAALTTGDFLLPGVTNIGGPGDLNVHGNFNWSSGSIGGSGDFNTAAGSVITLSGGGTKTFSRQDWNNYGTVNWTGGNLDLPVVTSVFNNGAGAAFNAQTGGNLSGLGAFANLAGATLNKTSVGTSDIQVGFSNAGTVNAANGTLKFSNAGGYTQSGGLTNLNGGSMLVSGIGGMTLNGGGLKGTGTLTAFVANNGATVKPGGSPGTLSIVGHYSQGPGGTLEIELGGLSQGVTYDLLSVTGAPVGLDGTLNITMYGGFTGTVADLFDVIFAGSGFSGNFATVNVPAGYAFNSGVLGSYYNLALTGTPAAPPAAVQDPSLQPASQITQGLDNLQQQIFDALTPPTEPEDQQQKRKGLPLCR